MQHRGYSVCQTHAVEVLLCSCQHIQTATARASHRLPLVHHQTVTPSQGLLCSTQSRQPERICQDVLGVPFHILRQSPVVKYCAVVARNVLHMDAYSQFQHGNQPHGVTYHCVHQLWLLLAQSDKNMPAKLRRKQYLHIVH